MARGLIHIVGAGVAGLSCAVRLAQAGSTAVIHEAAGHAGGRARSFHDDTLGCEIDNGNHLLLSGNHAALSFLDAIGARDRLAVADAAAFPFVDLASGDRWTVRPGPGRSPWWMFDPARRVPDSGPRDYLAAVRLAFAGERSVADCLDAGRPAYRRFWEPLAVAVLNTAADEAAARLLWPVLVETFGRGEAACRPCMARDGLSRTFVDPAVDFLAARGIALRLGRRLRRISVANDRVESLDFGDDRVTLDPDDAVVLAVPPAGAAALLPDLTVPDQSRPIVNAHFRLDAPPAVPGDSTGPLCFLGMIGGAADWLFLRGTVVSVTVSAAERLVEQPADDIATQLWADVARALDLDPDAMPPHRVIKEKRATFAQTPAQIRRRPPARGPLRNLVLAGDWTDTGLPATIEGAIRSGRDAAAATLAYDE